MVPSSARQIRQVREMTVFFPPPEGRAAGRRVLRRSVFAVPQAGADVFDSACGSGHAGSCAVGLFSSGQGRCSPKFTEQCRLLRPPQNIRRTHCARAAKSYACEKNALTASGARPLFQNFSVLSSTATIAARVEKRFQRSTACPSAEAPFPSARRKNRRALRRPQRSRVFSVRAGETQHVVHSLAGLPRFPPRGKDESGTLVGESWQRFPPRTEKTLGEHGFQFF